MNQENKKITVRAETAADYPQTFEVNALAFGREEEGRLVESVRESEDHFPELSIVAVMGEKIVGHILFSLISIVTDSGAVPALSLAPMAVRPEHQNQGIGSKLVRQGLRECERLGHGIVIVVGHPKYYPRFGFLPARERGLEAPFPVPDEAFMALELFPGALDGIRGMVEYPPAFDQAI
jgi:putative acetyltransferase